MVSISYICSYNVFSLLFISSTFFFTAKKTWHLFNLLPRKVHKYITYDPTNQNVTATVLFGTDEAECPFQIATLNNIQEDVADEKAQMLDSVIKAALAEASK